MSQINNPLPKAQYVSKGIPNKGLRWYVPHMYGVRTPEPYHYVVMYQKKSRYEGLIDQHSLLLDSHRANIRKRLISVTIPK